MILSKTSISPFKLRGASGSSVSDPVYESYYLNESAGSLDNGDIFDATLFSTKIFSCRMVFRANKLATSHTIFGKYNSTGNQRSFLFRRLSTGKFQLDISSSGSANAFQLETVASTFDVMAWQDIVLTVDDTAGAGLAKFKLYVNGTLATLQVLSGAIPTNIAFFNSTARLYAGAQGAGATTIANGYINQYGFTSDVITAGEATSLYNSGQIKKLQNVCNNIVLNCYGGTWDGSKYVVPDTAGNTVVSISMQNYALNRQVSPYVTTAWCYIHAGQSNCRGTAAMADLQAGYVGTSESFYVYSLSTVNYARINSTANNNQFGQAQNQFGIEFKCSTLRETANLNRPIQWLKYSQGGTGLASVAQGGGSVNWNPATVGSLYDDLETYITSTVSFNTARGLTTVFKGIVWQQGEDDANLAGTANVYLSNMESLKTALESHIGYSIKWYVVRMNPTYVRPATATVRTAQLDFVATNAAVARLIDSDDAGLLPDTIHLSASGNELIGGRVVELIVADVAAE